MMSSTSDSQNGPVVEDFYGIVSDSKLIADSLMAILLQTKFQQTLCVADQSGLRMTTQKGGGTMQACVHFPKDVFVNYACTQEKVEFGVDLATVLPCVNFFTSALESVPLRLAFRTDTMKLYLSMPDQDFVRECKIPSLDAVPIADFPFADFPVDNDVILDAAIFKSMLDGLDFADLAVSVKMAPVDPVLQLTCDGPEGLSCDVVLKKSSEAVRSFRFDRTREHAYHLRSLLSITPALNFAESAKLQMNSQGILSIVVWLRGFGSQSNPCFIEYMFYPEKDLE
eukprot:Rmarinus@m.8958